jgi:hypothetical protein
LKTRVTLKDLAAQFPHIRPTFFALPILWAELIGTPVPRRNQFYEWVSEYSDEEIAAAIVETAYFAETLAGKEVIALVGLFSE